MERSLFADELVEVLGTSEKKNVKEMLARDRRRGIDLVASRAIARREEDLEG